jgi:hypothetical protein
MALHPYIGVGPAVRKHIVPVYYPPRARIDFRDPLSKEQTEPVRVLGYVRDWAVITNLPPQRNEVPVCVPKREIYINIQPTTSTANQQCQKQI